MSSESVSTSDDGGRKRSKPIMEKRRRARINASLAELKTLLMDVIKSEGTRASKMEKADILEMTVRHLRHLQRQNITGCGSLSQLPVSKYQLGFNECANEISQFLGTIDTTNVELRARILDHLAGRVSSGETHKFSPDVTCSATSCSTSKAKYVDIRPNIEAVISSTTNPRDPSPFSSGPQRSPNESASENRHTLLANRSPDTSLLTGNKGILSATGQSKSGQERDTTSGVTNDINNNSSSKDCLNPIRHISIPLDSDEKCNSMKEQFPAMRKEPTTAITNISNTYTTTGSMCGGVQFVPTGFSAGNVAILIPSNMAANAPITGYLLPVPVYTPPVLPSVPNQPVILQTNGNNANSTNTNAMAISSIGSSQKGRATNASVSHESSERRSASQNKPTLDESRHSRDEQPQQDDMWRPW